MKLAIRDRIAPDDELDADDGEASEPPSSATEITESAEPKRLPND
jgi:preprotein translocase subunit YajC